MHEIEIVKADLAVRSHQEAVLAMVDAYSNDPMGDGRSLSEEVRANLISALHNHPTTLIMLAMHNNQPVGIAVCFRGFSTFVAKPLINIHDFYVAPAMRGTGLAERMLENVEQQARAMGCCKLTLEVLEDNPRARKAYSNFGFSHPVYLGEDCKSIFLSKSLADENH